MTGFKSIFFQLLCSNGTLFCRLLTTEKNCVSRDLLQFLLPWLRGSTTKHYSLCCCGSVEIIRSDMILQDVPSWSLPYLLISVSYLIAAVEDHNLKQEMTDTIVRCHRFMGKREGCGEIRIYQMGNGGLYKFLIFFPNFT